MPAGIHSKLSEYELLRLERIKRNKAFMTQLGLDDAAKKVRQAARPAPRTPMLGKRKERITEGSPSPSRRSTRSSGKPIIYTDASLEEFWERERQVNAA
jgi:hypothetical protein